MTPESTNPFTDQQDWPLEPCAGDTHTDDQGRLWTCYPICYGARNGRWAYYRTANQPQQGIVVDTRQHLHAAHFAGMLSIPWDGLSKLGWVLAKAHCSPAPDKLEPLPIEAVRFERLEKPPED